MARGENGSWFPIKSISPAFAALLVQCAVALLIAVFAFLCWHFGQIRFTLLQVVVAQALLALFLTRWLKMAWWWSLIQPLFPIAVVLMWRLSLPASLYFSLFFLLLVIYWSTYRTQVPYFPSTRSVWQAVEEFLPQDHRFSFVDVGSGLGGLVLSLNKKYPSGNFSGVEVAPLPWLISAVRQRLSGSPARFLWSRYERINFADFDVVFAYLSPAAMEALWCKARSEMRAGSQLISFEFQVPGIAETSCVEVPVGQAQSRKLYVWVM